jgi:glycosyltransferase involved in cell wall biosynthesis
VPKSNVTNGFMKNHTSSRFLRFKRWALNYYTRTVCSIADRVIVHTELAKITLAQDYSVCPKKTHVIPHGIDQTFFSAEDDLFEIKSLINKNQRIVSYFGLVRHGKGLEDLVKAWKKVKVESAQLLIIGGKHPMLDDNCYENLVQLIKELGLEESILFSGYVLDNRLPVYLRESDVFVFPYNEWGDVIASSGALSIVAPYLKPLIVTDVPAFSYLKTSGAAVVVKKGDINGLASAIMEVLTNAQTRSLLVDNLCKWLPQSKWSLVAKMTAELYLELA